MRTHRFLPFFAVPLLAAACSAGGGAHDEPLGAEGSAETASRHGRPEIRHVLLLSVDGLHQEDLARYVAAKPRSALAALVASGLEYTDAHTTTPSDSFPGMLSFVTGGTPKTTGVYYDDSYDRTLYAPGSGCKGSPGTEVVFDESVEYDDSKVFSGGINPANLPLALRDDGSCVPVYPHDFVRTNTAFEVVRAFGGHTAWSDKHPAYDILNGPSGEGIEDLFAPEINSLIKNGGVVNGVDLAGSLALCDGTTNSLPLAKVSDFTTCEPAVMAYDDAKVQAILNEIDGKTSDGARAAHVPTLFGMNFQQVSVAEKLPVGGYADADGTPSKLLEGALDHVDASLARIVGALRARGIERHTLVIVSAKHGQSPVAPGALHMEAGGHGTADVQDPLPFVNAVDANVDQVFSSFVNPNSGNAYAIAGHLQTDDVGILWLQDQSASNVAGVVAALDRSAAAIEASTLPPGTVFSRNITSGAELAAIFGDPTSGDPVAAARAPNAFIQPNHGVIYSGSSKKIAEHGGGSLDDTNVALVVSNPAFRARVIDARVTTTQVAPTILRALDLPEWALWSVVREGTRALPGARW
jgi:arylsulfatase A-like enzyme